MRILALLPIALLALSGCTTPEPSVDILPPTGPLLPDGTAAPLSIAMSECAEQLGAFPVEASDVAPFLPAGFSPVAFQDTPFVTMVVVTYTCTSGNATVNEAMRAVTVTPPAAWANASATFHLVPIEAYTDRADLLDIYHAWGGNLTHRQATVDVTVATPENPLVRVGSVTVAEGAGRFTLDTVAPMGEGEVAGGARLFLVDADLNVTGAFDVSWTPSAMGAGPGTAFYGYDAATPAGAVPVAAPGVAFHFWGGYAYKLAYVELPAAAPTA